MSYRSAVIRAGYVNGYDPTKRLSGADIRGMPRRLGRDGGSVIAVTGVQSNEQPKTS
jgi:hypothetical protein